MAHVVEDVVAAFNKARFEVADDFDKMRAGNMQFYRANAQAWVDGVYREYGDEGWGQLATYGAALVSSTGEVLLDFVKGVGAATFLDPLRLGAGAQKGTVGGYAEDALRVVGVVGGVLKVLKFAKFLRGASSVGGGVMSCTPTSAGKALIFCRSPGDLVEPISHIRRRDGSSRCAPLLAIPCDQEAVRASLS